MQTDSKDTPLMKQYKEIKIKYPDSILLFRVGDFYETFGEDAIKTSEILNIILTKKGIGSISEVELAGFPYHSLNNHLPKLVKAGCRVAICDQLEDPKSTKKIVKRGVTELVTPGLAIIRIEDELSHLLGRVVDLRTPKDLSRYFRLLRVLQEAMVIYEQS